MYIRLARESSVHLPYAAMMYCGNPEAANLVAPPYRSEWVKNLLRVSPKSSHVAFITSDIVSPFRIGNPGICHTKSNSVAIHVSIMVTMQMPELSG